METYSSILGDRYIRHKHFGVKIFRAKATLRKMYKAIKAIELTVLAKLCGLAKFPTFSVCIGKALTYIVLWPYSTKPCKHSDILIMSLQSSCQHWVTHVCHCTVTINNHLIDFILLYKVIIYCRIFLFSFSPGVVLRSVRPNVGRSLQLTILRHVPHCNV